MFVYNQDYKENNKDLFDSWTKNPNLKKTNYVVLNSTESYIVLNEYKTDNKAKANPGKAEEKKEKNDNKRAGRAASGSQKVFA